MINKTYPTLLQRLGLKGQNPQLRLRPEVVPVIILEDTSHTGTASAVVASPYHGIVTQGEFIAPGVGVILADTEPLDAGAYEGFVWTHCTEQARFAFQYRNADNTSNVQVDILYAAGATLASQLSQTRALPFFVTLRQGERLRVVVHAAIGALVQTQVTIFIRHT